ncbi:hypothetical protein Pelo_15878 [Pelomyxa schiedti]|nr:hypothetical protein Pelo_15878 [Pelomyxa schiedti]
MMTDHGAQLRCVALHLCLVCIWILGPLFPNPPSSFAMQVPPRKKQLCIHLAPLPQILEHIRTTSKQRKL